MERSYVRRKWMAFTDLFKDKNEINEKTVVGFISFAIMVIYAIISVVGSLLGYEIPINETIYASFVSVTLGSFGIAAVGKAVDDYSRNREDVVYTRRFNNQIDEKKIETDQSEIDDYKEVTNRE